MPRKKRPTCGIDLDKEMRAILMAATRETCLSDAQKLVNLGFPAALSFKMVSDIVIAKENREIP